MKISEVSEFLILSYTQNQKLGNLENMSLPSNSESSYKSRFKNGKNMNWAKSRKVPIWFKRKNKTFRDFRVFNFALHPRSKTRESWKFCLPRILTLVVTQDLKTPKKWTETKIKRFRYDLEQNKNFRGFWVFNFARHPNLKTPNLGKFCFIWLFITLLNVVTLK